MLFQLARVDRGEGKDDIARRCFQINKAEQFKEFICQNPGLNRPKLVCIYEKDATYVNVTGTPVNPLDAEDANPAIVVIIQIFDQFLLEVFH